MALAVCGWWYGRNALLYHDPTLIQHHLVIVSRRDPTPLGYILHEVPSIFWSYWGRFTCDLSPDAWYFVFWGAVVLLGLVGLVLEWRSLGGLARTALFLLAIWFVLVFFGWFRWNLLASGVQGRLLFPATGTVSLLIASGLSALMRRAWLLSGRTSAREEARAPALLSAGLLLMWLALALWVLFGLIGPTFAPPTRHASAEGLDIPQRVNGSFAAPGGNVELLGYAVRPHDVAPGQVVEVTLYLSARQRLTDTYSLGLWLVSAIPGDTLRLAGLDTWPGNGNYPTTVWKPGEIVQEVYRVTIPSGVERAQAWAIQLNMYRAGQRGWFPFALAGRPAGDRAILGLVRVGASMVLEVPPEARLAPAPVLASPSRCVAPA